MVVNFPPLKLNFRNGNVLTLFLVISSNNSTSFAEFASDYESIQKINMKFLIYLREGKKIFEKEKKI